MTVTDEALVAGAIRSHNTETTDGAWDAEAARRNLPNDEAALHAAHAWRDAEGSATAKATFRALHHSVTQAGEVGAANLSACLSGIHALNRADSTIPAGDRGSVYAHLRNHLISGGRSDASIPALRDSNAEAGVDESIQAATEYIAEKYGAKDGVTAAADTAADGETAESGAPMQDGQGVRYRQWRMPIAVVEGVETGDLREIDAEALTWREFPRPVMVLTSTTQGHDEAELVGRIDSAERVDASAMVDPRTGEPYGEGAYAIQLEGVLTNEELADRTVDLIGGGFLRSVSVDMSDVTEVYDLVDVDGNVIDADTADEDTLMNARLKQRIVAGRIMGVTILPFEAFEVAYIEMVDDEGNVGPATKPGDGTAKRPAESIRASAPPNPRRCLPCETGTLTAAAAPVEPPRAWFERMETDGYDRRIFVTDEGRVYGYVAPWGVCHIGIQGECIEAPKSNINYALFTTASVKTAEGDIIPTGRLTLGTGHAGIRAKAVAAVEHYDNTGTAVADVVVGEDEFGIWFSGALRPDVTPERIRTLRGSQLSGDWRPWGGNTELAAALCVNTGGFPVVQQLVASGRRVALVAALGAFHSPEATAPELKELADLLPELRASAAREQAARDTEAAALLARADEARGRMRTLTAAALRARVTMDR